MQIVRNSEELSQARAQLTGKVALVPTMGALHTGHMALIAKAKEGADKVVASIFVNPTQFGEGEDFGRYPRREAEDIKMLEEARCDLLWAPSVENVYPRGFATSLSVGGIGDLWEGGEPNWPAVCSIPQAKLHLYGKSEPRRGRKMGHITALADSPADAARIACEARARLKGAF